MTSRRWLTVAAAAFAVAAAPAPARTWLVDPVSPRAADDGPGSDDSPLATLDEAAKRLQPGDTLRIAPRVYRQALLLPRRDWSSAAQTVIEGLAGADGRWPELRGSVLATGWRADDRMAGLHWLPWRDQPQQVFVDGKPLQQVGGTVFGGFPDGGDPALARLHARHGGIWPGRLPPRPPHDLPANSFMYERESGRLWLQCGCADPDRRQVEVATLPVLIGGSDLANVTIRRLAVRHANSTTATRGAAVSLVGRQLTLQDIDVQHVDGYGIGVRGDDITVERSRVGHAGQLGIAAKGRRIRVAGNRFHDNNTRGFNKSWEAGGGKFVGDGPHDSEVVDNRVDGNQGDGLWFDWGPRRNLIRGNVVANNTGFGIHHEAAFDGRIENNLVVHNGQRGIYLPQSSGTVVAGNVVVGNRLEGIVVVDEGRRDPGSRLDLENKANRVCGNVVAWNRGGAIVLPARLLDNRSERNTVVGTGTELRFALGWWPNRIRPTDLDLSNWRGVSNQDRESSVVPRPADAAIVRRLAAWGPPADVRGAVRELGLSAGALGADCPS